MSSAEPKQNAEHWRRPPTSGSGCLPGKGERASPHAGNATLDLSLSSLVQVREKRKSKPLYYIIPIRKFDSI